MLLNIIVSPFLATKEKYPKKSEIVPRFVCLSIMLQ